MSKDSIERAKPSMFNCPVVCNYDIEADSIGGHDVDLVHPDEGGMRLVNLTNAIGVVPAGANTWWETKDDSGSAHEYFTTEIILWKRSPAYQKIARDGITSQSMEISVTNGHMQDGVFVIEDFTFTAFCLLGDDIEPCFESASLQMFSKDSVKQQFTLMMQEFKETFTMVQPSQEAVIHLQKYSEGGEEVLDKKNELMAEFGLTADALDFSIEDFTVEELRTKFEAMKNGGGKPETTNDGQENFELEGQFIQELWTALEAETITTEWGSMPRYWYVDYDRDASEVYAQDYEDGWNLYGFAYSMNGDHVVIDFECKKRKKYSIVDFDEGEQATPTGKLFELATKRFSEVNAEWTAKYQKATEEATANTDELASLRKFKADVESSEEKDKRDEVFARFEDLTGIEAFEVLREHSLEYNLETLEEKCFAIRGRNGVAAKFSHEPKSPKLPVEKRAVENEPYGGIFAKYGIAASIQHN